MQAIRMFTGRAALLLLSLFLTSVSASGQSDVAKLVREVQANTSRIHDSIRSVRFTGKSKNYFYGGWDAMDMQLIPETEEYHFEGIWIKPDSLRIKITALRKTIADHPLYVNTEFEKEGYLDRVSSDHPIPNPIRFSYDVSAFGLDRGTMLNEDGKRISSWPVFPFAEGADSLYHYEYISEVGLDHRKVIEIFVTPKFKDIPAVSGKFMIDGDEKVVVGSDIVFNEAAGVFNPENDNGYKAGTAYPFVPIKYEEEHRTRTRKLLVHSVYWFPETVEEDLIFNTMGFLLKQHREVDFSSYIINPEENDFGENKKLSYTIDPELEKALNKGLEDPHTLTIEEENEIIGNIETQNASRTVNSEIFEWESVAQDALHNSLGYKSGKVFQFKKAFEDNIHYNRVEGFRVDYGLTLSNILVDNSSLTVKGGYGFENERGKGEAAWLFFPDEEKKFFVEADLYNTIGFDENRIRFSDGKNTFSSLFYCTDYRDFYYKSGWSLGLGYRLSDFLAVKLTGVSHTEKPADINTTFSIFRHGRPFRMNPGILQGELRSLRASVLYNTKNISAGLRAEYSDTKSLHSDFSYSKLYADFAWSHKHNRQSKMNISLSGGISGGTLPPQRWFDLGGKSLFNYNGILRGVGYKAFTGDKMAVGTAEYTLYAGSFNGIGKQKSFFEHVRSMTKFYFWSGLGWSELSDRNLLNAAAILSPRITTDGLYHEFGIGIGDRINLIRIDFIRNSISGNKILAGFNVMR